MKPGGSVRGELANFTSPWGDLRGRAVHVVDVLRARALALRHVVVPEVHGVPALPLEREHLRLPIACQFVFLTCIQITYKFAYMWSGTFVNQIFLQVIRIRKIYVI